MSRIVKQKGVYKLLQEGDSEKCLKISEFLSFIVCSLILVEKWRLVSSVFQYSGIYIPNKEIGIIQATRDL